MYALKAVGGLQSLRSIIARHASARVLDLHTVAEECSDDPDHRARPMFTHPVLNRTIIAKHHVRPGEVGWSASQPGVATKVIFPFDPDDLDLGGQFLFLGSSDLSGELARHLDWGKANLERDVRVLRALDRMPTLDPFLLREQLTAQEIDVAPCYFRLSEADRTEMLDFVADQLQALIRLCFGDLVQRDDQAQRLSALLLSEGNAPELAPLRMTMRMQEDEFRDAMFCWKALLYYRWRARLLAPDVKETRRYIGWVDIAKFDAETATFIKDGVKRIEAMIGDSQRGLAEAFAAYDDVFKALTVQKSPEPFRRFLKQGPRIFARLGERMGRLEQLVSFWAHQFPDKRTRTASPEAIFDGLRNLLNALSLNAERSEPAREDLRDETPEPAARSEKLPVPTPDEATA